MSETAESEMTFWDHLDDLRKILFRIAAFVTIVATIFFMYMKELFDNVILAPTRNDFFFIQMDEWHEWKIAHFS